jgi:hypothetical protein
MGTGCSIIDCIVPTMLAGNVPNFLGGNVPSKQVGNAAVISCMHIYVVHSCVIYHTSPCFNLSNVIHLVYVYLYILPLTDMNIKKEI